jgi:type IV secretory pathway VirJ component
VSALQLKEKLELEQLRAMNRRYEKEIQDLEEERLKLKAALRLQAMNDGERALKLGLDYDNLLAVERYADRLREGQQPHLEDKDLLQLQKEVKQLRSTLKKTKHALSIATLHNEELQQQLQLLHSSNSHSTLLTSYNNTMNTAHMSTVNSNMSTVNSNMSTMNSHMSTTQPHSVTTATAEREEGKHTEQRVQAVTVTAGVEEWQQLSEKEKDAVIGYLNAELIACMEELSHKEQELAALQTELTTYRDQLALINEQHKQLYSNHQQVKQHLELQLHNSKQALDKLTAEYNQLKVTADTLQKWSDATAHVPINRSMHL